MEDFVPTPELTALFKRCAADDMQVAMAAQRQIAAAIQEPIRSAVKFGDVVGDLYTEVPVDAHQPAEFALHFLAPGQEREVTAYAIPTTGALPQRHSEGDYVMVPTYEVGSSHDVPMRFVENARWDVLSEVRSVLDMGMTRKDNTDGWRTALAAAAGRNLVVLDDEARPGFFSKRLTSLAKIVMRRQAGGNSTSVNRGQLSRVYLSPEALEDARVWDNTVVDEVTRRDIFISEEYGVTRLFGVDLRPLDELGVGQEFQQYLTSTLSATLPSYTRNGSSEQKLEFAVGVDLYNKNAFVHPVKKKAVVLEDPMLFWQRRVGYKAWKEAGWAVLDSRRVCLLAI